MATPEDEIRNLKEINNDLVQKVQYWKMLAAEKDKEKLNLMKEMNELRLKLSQHRRTVNVQAKALATALQSSSEGVLNCLIKASNEITSSMELVDGYMRDRDELDIILSPGWTARSGNSSSERKDKVHRVPPMMGGQSIQPVVALSRTIFDTSRRQPATRTNENRNVTGQAVPMSMLQDVYIPLTRIDMQDLQNSMGSDDNDDDDSAELTGPNDSEERLNEESQRMAEHEEYVEHVEGQLDAVAEVSEPEDVAETPSRTRLDNPLEGPSWMLDVTANNQAEAPKSPEPDSTTEPEAEVLRSPLLTIPKRRIRKPACPSPLSQQFSPTVRRRKRSHSPPASPYSPLHRNSTSNRILKVVVAKMQLESPSTPPPRRVTGAGTGAGDATGTRFDAPSPNGATVPGVIVSVDVERRVTAEPPTTKRPSERAPDRDHTHNDRGGRSCSRERSSDSDSGGAEGRARRPRKPVTYKEKPLNRKMRR